jgi:hypothetical protein
VALKVGPLTRDDLRAVWEGAVDGAYREPFLRAGDGGGLEVHSQSWAQYERTSKAIDVTTQALFILPWSGQSNPPAAGEANAVVTLTLSRTVRLEQPLLLAAGRILAEEETTDAAPDNGITVLTGRRYVLLDDVLFMPGDRGPFEVLAQAERPGYGYNNPLPGTIRVLDQPGALFANIQATIDATLPGPLDVNQTARVHLTTQNVPDMFVAEQVGQYVLMTAGSNAGNIARIVAFYPPDLTTIPTKGSAVDLEILHVIDADVFAGTFMPGELVDFSINGLVGRVVGESIVNGVKRIAFVVLRGNPLTVPLGASILTGRGSGATALSRTYLFRQLFTSEAPPPGASWRILGWPDDWGLSVTNVLAPSGGRLGWLDELGAERNINRASGEDDDTYRRRVHQIADVVTPNAIRRALTKALGVLPFCFREVGTTALRGWFFDGDLGPAGGQSNTILAVADQDDCYDTDVVLFTGAMAPGPAFDGTDGNHEPVVLEDAINNVSMMGYFGRLDPGPVFVLVRRSGVLPSPIAGFQIRGLRSGAVFLPATSSVPASVNARRWRTYFDYEQFRAFFLVGLPRLDIGDYGFAYDGGMHNAYDAAPFDDFYDGAPLGAASVYRSVFQAIDTTRAGGVGFQLYIEDIGCP